MKNTKTDKLTSMNFTIAFNKELKEDESYFFIPGGYELSSGKKFDFIETENSINPKNNKELLFHVSCFDSIYAEEANKDFDSCFISSEDIIASSFAEFYIYLEKTDINVVEIKNLSFDILRDGKVIEIPADKAQIISINNYFNNCLRQ